MLQLQGTLWTATSESSESDYQGRLNDSPALREAIKVAANSVTTSDSVEKRSRPYYAPVSHEALCQVVG